MSEQVLIKIIRQRPIKLPNKRIHGLNIKIVFVSGKIIIKTTKKKVYSSSRLSMKSKVVVFQKFPVFLKKEFCFCFFFLTISLTQREKR